MKPDCFLRRHPLNLRANELQVHHDRPFGFTQAQIQAQAAPGQPVVFMLQNGSRWMGEDYADLDQLLDMLADCELDPMFEDYGNFIQERTISATDDEPLWPAGFWDFSGNFYHISHGFHIVTNDPGVVVELTEAIKRNRSTPAYQQAREERQNAKRQRAADQKAYLARK